MLILGSYRPTDSIIGQHPIRRLHQDLEIHERCGELRLDRLSRMQKSSDISHCGSAMMRWRSTLTEPVFERTQGQPLFIASLIKYFIDQRVIVETDGAWRLSSLIGDSARWRTDRSC